MIIGLLAQKQNGKDTAADYLISQHGFRRYGFADPMKEGVRYMFDLSTDQLYGHLKEVVDERWGVTPRRIMEVMGTEMFQYDLPRNIPEILEKVGEAGRSFWVYRFNLERPKFPENTKFVFSDVRFHHEISAIQKMGGIILKIVRPGYENNNPHASEAEIATAKYDHLIMNDTTLEDFYNKLDNLLYGTLAENRIRA